MSWRGGHGGPEWISRQIASFGRYAEKRPQGLHADANGALPLKSLMQVWGRHQGLSEQDVLNALHENLTYAETGAPRFTIEGEGSNVSIRVHKRGSSWRGNWQQHQAASSTQWQRGGDRWSGGAASSQSLQEGGADAASADSAESSRPVASPNRAAFNVFGGAESEGGQGVWAAPASERKEESDGDRKEDRDKSSDDWWWKKEAWWADAGEDKRRGEDNCRGEASWRSSESRAEDRGREWSWSEGEQVQRWLGWVLKSGHRDIGIWLKDNEWASLDVLAEELRSSKAHLRVENASDLKQVLEMTDEAGRFEINDAGDVRKVQRDSRVARTPAGDSGGKSWGSSWGGSSRDSHRATWRTEEEAEEPPAKRRHASSEDEPRAPSKPPGLHWKKYVDGGVIWWYYEGPLGKWWVNEEGGEPEPFPEDEDVQ